MDDKKIGGISSFTLHILAMAFMLCDHMWATIVPGHLWLTCVGRLAFPIFAFMLVEGYFYTHNLKKYLLRLLIFAVISEIPFDLMYGGTAFYPFHQNVMWTFLIGLLLITAVDKVRSKEKLWLTVIVFAAAAGAGWLFGMFTMVDYYGYGILTVMVFYLFHGRKWWCFAGQLAGLYWINCIALRGMIIPITVFGNDFEFVQQGFALLALIPIWLYKGRQGPYNKVIKYCFYSFYPVHILILALLWMYV